MVIKKVTAAEMDSIIKTRKPLGLFYKLEYIAVDNRNGHAWTEAFQDLRTCRKWLRDEFEVGDD